MKRKAECKGLNTCHLDSEGAAQGNSYLIGTLTCEYIYSVCKMETINNKCTAARRKIVRVDVAMEVNTKTGKKLNKQDCVLKDVNASCRIVLWENDVGKLKKGQSYSLIKVLVRQYDGVKYFSLSDGTSIEPIQDIQEISDDDYDEETSQILLVATGEIVAVLSISDYSSCVSCTGMVQSINEVLGKCTKCGATLKLNKCNQSKSAKIVISNEVSHCLQ